MCLSCLSVFSLRVGESVYEFWNVLYVLRSLQEYSIVYNSGCGCGNVSLRLNDFVCKGVLRVAELRRTESQVSFLGYFNRPSVGREQPFCVTKL